MPSVRNLVPEHVEHAVLESALENPSLGQKRARDELRQRGVFISAAGVHCVWLCRHDLDTFKKRLKALENMWRRQLKFSLKLSSEPWKRPRRNRKKIYLSVDELQQDLDEWMDKYNTRRTNQGEGCQGRTPMETFLENLPLAKEKMLGIKAEERLAAAKSCWISNLSLQLNSRATCDPALVIR